MIHFQRIALFILAFTLMMSVNTAFARGKEKLPEIKTIEIEQPHAWCYVMLNDNSGAIGDINMWACVPKCLCGSKCRNNEPIISKEDEDADS